MWLKNMLQTMELSPAHTECALGTFDFTLNFRAETLTRII